MYKKITAICLALLLLAAQAASASTFTLAGFDGENSNHVWSENHFFTRMTERTGTSFQFTEYTDSSKWQDAKDAMFQSGDLPDVLFKASLSLEEQVRYSDEGQLIDLLPLLQDNAPNLWALLQANPEWLQTITLPNGKVAALPTINRLSMQNAMWINQTWLDALGLEKPADFESLLSVLRAFQQKDPNQNGKQDEIPLSFLGPWDLKFLSHAFGFVANDYNIYVDGEGQVQYLPLQAGYADFLKALASMYREGLLDQNGFTTADTLRAVNDDKAALTYGMFFGPNPYNLLTVSLGEQYTMLEPLVFAGKQIYRDLFGPIATGAFAITSACKNPEEVLRWADILYTPEGAAEAMAGVEGTDYVWSDDGTWSYAMDLEQNSSYILYDLSLYDTGNMPWMFPTDFYASYDIDNLRSVTRSLIGLQTLVVDPFPYSYVLSLDQRNFIDPLQMELGRYVDECIAKFVLGELDVNAQEDLNAFYAGLQDRGVEKFTSFWQEIYDQQRIR